MSKNNQTNAAKKRTKFLVDVRCRENATWQGNLLWVDQNKQCSFRSALELLKLIDGALEQEMAEDKITSEESI